MKSQRKTAASQAKQGRQQLRIIGGNWRGRKLSFPAIDDLRPTSDRVRETLFNWLQMEIAGTRCLDLFAGSGALGLEALSRSAQHVSFIEKDRHATQQIREHLHVLNCDKGEVINQDALSYIDHCGKQFDIIFLDPPFRIDCAESLCQQINKQQLLAAGGYLYLESPKARALPQLPDNWSVKKEKRAGDVTFYLIQHGAGIEQTSIDFGNKTQSR